MIFKYASQIAKDVIGTNTTPKKVGLINVVGGFKDIPETLSSELKCPICEGDSYSILAEDPKDVFTKMMWICTNVSCGLYKRGVIKPATTIQPTHHRAIVWPLYCEINGIGDMHHEVCFEDVKQDKGKIDYLLKFANKPSGIIYMQGGPGTGKTFAAMATCEYFTRKNTSCIFTTQKQMFDKWLETFKDKGFNSFIDKINQIELLVIDDFGTAEVSAGFLSFFMDLINTRMQWKNRGTIITTNLNDKKFIEYCGEALSDRIKTGQLFEFSGESRRIKQAL